MGIIILIWQKRKKTLKGLEWLTQESTQLLSVTAYVKAWAVGCLCQNPSSTTDRSFRNHCWHFRRINYFPLPFHLLSLISPVYLQSLLYNKYFSIICITCYFPLTFHFNVFQQIYILRLLSSQIHQHISFSIHCKLLQQKFEKYLIYSLFIFLSLNFYLTLLSIWYLF